MNKIVRRITSVVMGAVFGSCIYLFWIIYKPLVIIPIIGITTYLVRCYFEEK